MQLFTILLSLVFLLNSTIIFSQKSVPRLSPKSFVGQTIGYTNVEIVYNSPGVKGRSVWGKLVPYDKVWRTGANEATTIKFDSEVLIEGKKVSSGKYSLFTIPGKDDWLIILNKVYDQWGAFNYKQEEDVIRFQIKPTTNHHVERLIFNFEYKAPYSSNVTLEWDKIKVTFEIKSEIKK